MMILKLLKRLCCEHDFRVQPKRINDRYYYYCYHKCGKVKKGDRLVYESNNIEAQSNALQSLINRE